MDRLKLSPREPPESDREQKRSDEGRVETSFGTFNPVVRSGRLVVKVILV